MSIFVGQQDMMFASKEHYEFYHQTTKRLKADCYLSSLVYTVGISEDTRRRWNSFYDEKNREIKLQVVNEPWQTGTSKKITHLAFQLYTDGTPTASTYDENDGEIQNFKECQRYSVSDIFCCSLAPFFVEAIKVRYPEYFTCRSVYNESCRIREEIMAEQ